MHSIYVYVYACVCVCVHVLACIPVGNIHACICTYISDDKL